MEPFKSILVDVDPTAAVHHELERAANLARRCGASLTIVGSTPVSTDARGAWPAGFNEDVIAARRHELGRLAGRVSGVPVASRLLVGESATVLIEEVVRSGHDLIVRAHARDVTASGSARYGAVDEVLLRKCPCAVLLVGPGRTPERPRIVGVVRARSDDPAEEALRLKVVELTLLMARLEIGAPMLLQTWVPFAEELIRANSLDDAFSAYVDAVRHRTAGDLARLAQSLEGDLSSVLTMSRKGELEDIVPEFAVKEGIDLVVMAAPTSVSGISDLLFGRASHKLLQRLTCSLLAVKG